MSKIKCDKCNNFAQWFYMPSDGEGNYCDKHVPRGCSCNDYEVIVGFTDNDGKVVHVSDNNPEGVEGKDWKWKEKGKLYTELDGEGRELPCCEFMYSKGGDDNEI